MLKALSILNSTRTDFAQSSAIIAAVAAVAVTAASTESFFPAMLFSSYRFLPIEIDKRVFFSFFIISLFPSFSQPAKGDGLHFYKILYRLF